MNANGIQFQKKRFTKKFQNSIIIYSMEKSIPFFWDFCSNETKVLIKNELIIYKTEPHSCIHWIIGSRNTLFDLKF